MGAVNAWMFHSVIELHIPGLRDLGDVSGYTSFKLLCVLLCYIVSFICNLNTAKYCCYVICVCYTTKYCRARRDNDGREDVNMAIARASQFWWLGLRAFTASFPIYLWFLFGPIPAILLLTSLILTHLCLHFFCCTQREIPQDSQYNNHPPQSELLTHVL